MQFFKQSTAASLIVGPILDSTGAEYAIAVIGDLSISKNGGTLTALASAATLTYIANGQYTLALTTGNTDTLGRADITCNKSTYQMPPVRISVLQATVFDALITNATNTTGGILAATATVSAAAGYIGATGAAVNGTNVNTLSGHDPGATIGTSTLTQTQVTGGAYSVQSASCVLGDARIANLDTTVSSRLATSGYTAPTNLTAAQIATGVWQDTVAGDFTAANSIGKSIMNGVALGTGLTVAAVSGAVGSVTGAVGSVTGNVGGNVTGAVGSVTGNVGGNVTGSVGSIATGGIVAASFAANAITAAVIAPDAIGASELAADAVTEIQNGLSTLTQTQVTGGAYALNSASFAFNAALDFTTTQKAATLARVTLVDTTTTNTDMRGTNNALLSASYTAPDNTNIGVAATQATTAATNTGTLLTNLAALAGKFTGITLLAQWLGLIAGKQVGNTTARTELNATGAGSGTYDETTDSTQAIRDRGDTAWGSSGGLTQADVRTAIGMASANLDTQLAGLSAASGTGAWTVAVTVNDGATVLESARVRFTKGAETYTTTTNASGVATFYLDSGTWTVVITLAGYTFTSTTLAVAASTTHTYSMTPVTITPSSTGKTTGYLTAEVNGVPTSGVKIYYRAAASPITGLSPDGASNYATSDSNGLVQITNLTKGQPYYFWRGSARRTVDFTVPADAGSTCELPGVLGAD